MHFPNLIKFYSPSGKVLRPQSVFFSRNKEFIVRTQGISKKANRGTKAGP
jgi:hypothetical protein